MLYGVICAGVLLLSSPLYSAPISAKARVRAQCIVACGSEAARKLVRQCIRSGVTPDGESSVCGSVCPSPASPSGAFQLAEPAPMRFAPNLLSLRARQRATLCIDAGRSRRSGAPVDPR